MAQIRSSIVVMSSTLLHKC